MHRETSRTPALSTAPVDAPCNSLSLFRPSAPPIHAPLTWAPTTLSISTFTFYHVNPTSTQPKIASQNCRPPVPPKPHAKSSLSQRRGLQPPDPPKQLRPLPPVPQIGLELDFKPLPQRPQQVQVYTTALFVAAFAVWFLLIVVMLPIIMEREAMVGLNTWLRRWW